MLLKVILMKMMTLDKYRKSTININSKLVLRWFFLSIDDKNWFSQMWNECEIMEILGSAMKSSLWFILYGKWTHSRILVWIWWNNMDSKRILFYWSYQPFKIRLWSTADLRMNRCCIRFLYLPGLFLEFRLNTGEVFGYFFV